MFFLAFVMYSVHCIVQKSPCYDVLYDLNSLGNFIQQPLRIFPSQAGIGDGFAIAMLADFLTAGFNVAFNHNPFHKSAQLFRVTAAVKHFFDNADLLEILLVGVGMVGVHDAGRIFKFRSI